jgi:hypothetical protein
MKFLCVGYFNREKMDARTEEEINAVMGECEPHLQELYETGQVLMDAGTGLEAKHIRRGGGKVIVSDGEETGEMIGSVFLIEAEDLDAAVGAARLHPAVQVEGGEEFGWRIEVRPVHYFKE